MTDAKGPAEFDEASLPDDWTVWNQEADGRLVLAYRPDVFTGDEVPAPCLPTLYVTHGARTRRPGTNPTSRTDGDDWYVTFYLEPEIVAINERFSARAPALERMLEVARAFAAGEIDYRELYQVPRETYFDRLDELTGSNDEPAPDRT